MFHARRACRGAGVRVIAAVRRANLVKAGGQLRGRHRDGWVAESARRWSFVRQPRVDDLEAVADDLHPHRAPRAAPRGAWEVRAMSLTS